MIKAFCIVLWIVMLIVGWLKLYRGVEFEKPGTMFISMWGYILASLVFVVGLRSVLENIL